MKGDGTGKVGLVKRMEVIVLFVLNLKTVVFIEESLRRM